MKNTLMGRTLKADKNFVPCPVQEDDEMYRVGIFEFNITKMREYIHGHPKEIKVESVAVKDFFKEFSTINESHLDSVRVSNPVILAEISPGRYNLIDGNHRMEKARRAGIENLKAYKLDMEQHMMFLTNKKSYAVYVEYWNEKLKE